MKRRTIGTVLGVALALAGLVAACGPGSQNGTTGTQQPAATSTSGAGASGAGASGAAQGDLDQLNQLLNGVDDSLSGADESASPEE